MDIIFIQGLTGKTVIGIHESELHDPQPLKIDIEAGVPRSTACDTDQIADTVDYSKVRSRIGRLMREHKLKLIESFAETIAAILVLDFGAEWVRVCVTKPCKFADVDAVGVRIERTATDFARPRWPILQGITATPADAAVHVNSPDEAAGDETARLPVEASRLAVND